MSQQISVAHVQQYKSNVLILSQQKGSRLSGCVRNDGEVVGKRVYFDRIGAVAATKKTTRHGDTPLTDTPHSRRSGVMFPYQWADMIDKSDKVRMLIDPTSSYTQNAVNALGRSKDMEIIGALDGSSYEGESGETTTVFPAGNIIPVNFPSGGDTGLTLGKLIESKRLFQSFDVDPQDDWYIAYGAQQLADALAISQLTSSDYNTYKALVDGKVTTFMGYTWVPTELLNVVNSERHVMIWAKSGVGLIVGEDISVDVGPRRDKSNGTQVYVEADIGAVRVEDAKVIRVLCQE